MSIQIKNFGTCPALIKPDFVYDDQITQNVKQILADIKNNGVKKLIEYTTRFDGATLDVDQLIIDLKSDAYDEVSDALKQVDESLMNILRKSCDSIFQFHQMQKLNGEKNWDIKIGAGYVGQRVLPLNSVGLYVPGGKAVYPSTVLMNIIPALVAKVENIVVATPPNAQGKVNPVVIAAVKVAMERVFNQLEEPKTLSVLILKAGGAQAIGALAYGLDLGPSNIDLKPVDKITGPGNAYVAEAKRQVLGLCGIDMIAGPSEVVIVADKYAKPQFIAADMLSQAEHDEMARSVLLTDSMELAQSVQKEIYRQLDILKQLSPKRKDIAQIAMDNSWDFGSIIGVFDDINEAVKMVNLIAPEHLELCVKNPEELLEKVKNAGAVFLGHYSPEALGDYFAGPNHTLPTSGTARFYSPLSVLDFCKRTSVIQYGEQELKEVYKDIAAFARAEGLIAHARSVEVRFENPKEE